MKPQHDSSLDLSDLLKPHIGLLVWIIFIGFGGGVLALYYADIHYLPEIAWKASLTFLGVISIIGGTIVVILSLLVFFPGFIWCRFLICDKLLDKHVFYMQGEGIGEACIFQITTRLGIPFLLLIGLAHVLLLLDFEGSVFFVWALVLLIFFFWYIWRLFRSELWGDQSKNLFLRLLTPSFWFNEQWRWHIRKFIFKLLFGTRKKEEQTAATPSEVAMDDIGKTKDAQKIADGANNRSLLGKTIGRAEKTAEKTEGIHPPHPSTSRLFKYAFWFDLSVIISFSALYLIYEISKNEKWSEDVLLALICTAIVFLSNCAVAVLYSKYSARAIAVSIIAATLLLFAADSSSSLATKLMAAYGFGGEQVVTIVVDEKGCVILQRLDIPFDLCDEKGYGRLSEVKLLSRLGSEYFFEFERKKAEERFPLPKKKRFALPKESVISWSVVVEDDSADSEGTSSPNTTGTFSRPGGDL